MNHDRALSEARETVENLFRGATSPPAILALRRLGVSNEGIAAALGIKSANVASFASGRLALPVKHLEPLRELLADVLAEAENAYSVSLGEDIALADRWAAAFPRNRMAREAAAHVAYEYENSLKYARTVLDWMERS